jgi:Domain of unknown function (DUF4189)
MRRVYILLASAVIATTFIAVASSTGASATPTQQGEQFGAMAFAPSLSSIGNGVDVEFASRKGAAKRAALADCQARGVSHSNYYGQDCQGAVWVRNGWAAVAWEKEPSAPPYKVAWGSGWGPTSDIAIFHANELCQQYAGAACPNHSAHLTPNFDPNKPTKGGPW